ncbi:MAG: NusG domain II-containing protein [Calditrichaeota bacterium]|nr:NusG domain II-containing protein [Calditrichota bacterium]
MKKLKNKSHWLHIWQELTTGDKILVIFLVFASLASMALLRAGQETGSAVEIKIKNAPYATLPLNQDTTFTVTGAIGETQIAIAGSRVRVLKSDCRQKICVKTGWVSRSGELIVCVPNQVVISVIGKKKEDYLNVITQ